MPSSLVTSYRGPGFPEITHCFDLSDEARQRRYGRGTHSPIVDLTAGEIATVEFSFDISEQQIPTGGKLIIAWRWPYDWGDLQGDDPAGDGYVNVCGPPSVAFKTDYHWIRGCEPWHHFLAVEVTEGTLKSGDRVQIICGDISGGGRGWRAPSCVMAAAGFLMLLDHLGNDRWIRLPDPPTYRIAAGRAVRLLAVAPSDAVAGEACEVCVRAEDKWGNPASLDCAPVLTAEYASDAGIEIGPASQPTDEGPAVHRFVVTFPRPNDHRLQAYDAQSGLSAVTNPICVRPQLPALQLFWGDLHSGQTEIGCGGGSLSEHYAFGRDVAGLQFITHQANDHYVTVDEWKHTRQVTEEFYEPGRYVPFLGCEWSPPTRDGGDRNVFYLHDEPRLRRSGRYFVEREPDPEPDIPTAAEFHDAFRDEEVLVNIHVGGRPTNLDWHEPKIEKLCEIHSTHGTSEWFVLDALSRGFRVAITAGTDGVMGRPGACHPGEHLIRNVPNGLTAIYAEELTRESLWRAFHTGRCYATTGPRIRLWVEVDGRPMGDTFTTNGNPKIDIAVDGTAPIERIDVLRGTEVIDTWNAAPANFESSRSLRLLWGGTEGRGTANVQRADWDGSLSIHNGTASIVKTVGYQSPADHVESADDRVIRWKSKTAGNTAGVVLRVEGDESSTFKFKSGPVSFDFRMNEVTLSPLTVDAGGVGRFVTVSPAPSNDGATSCELSFTDDSPIAGTSPYWVRVTQTDQEKAWSTPVYVTRE